MTHPTNIIHGTTETAVRCEIGPGRTRCPPCEVRFRKTRAAIGKQAKREAAAATKKHREWLAGLRRRGS